MVTGATSTTSSGGGVLRASRGDAYGEQSTRRRGGFDAGSHSESDEVDGELGQAETATERRWRSRHREVEDELGKVVRGLPVSRGSAERDRSTRQSFWSWRKGEGGLVAAVVLDGGGERVR